MDAEPRDKDGNIIQVGILVEAGLIAVAIGLSKMGLSDANQPLQALNRSITLQGFYWGTIASIPLIGFLLALHFAKFRWIESLRRFSDEHIKPLFRDATIVELAALALAAGIGEEILFRWCLQGGISSLLAPQLGSIVANPIGLVIASVVFGLCHAASRTYFTITFIGGIYLGVAMILTSNWVVPAVAHALYDFVAMIYLVKMSAPSLVPTNPSYD